MENPTQLDVVLAPSPQPEGRPPAAPWASSVAASVEHASRRLLELREPDGHWCAEIEGDTILESEYVLTLYFLGRAEPSKVSKAAA